LSKKNVWLQLQDEIGTPKESKKHLLHMFVWKKSLLQMLALSTPQITCQSEVRMIYE